MVTTLAVTDASSNYSGAVAIAVERAALRIGIEPDSLHQFVHGRVKAAERLGILAEELVKVGCTEQALALRDPMDAAIENSPAEDLLKLMPTAEVADASEDCAQTAFLVHQTPETLKRYLSENDDQIAKALRVKRAGYALLARWQGGVQ